MKLSRVEVLESIRMFLKEHITMALICVLFFMVYKDLTNHGLILLILAFAVLYATVMAVCHYGLSKFTQYEKNHTVTPQRLVGYSFLIAMPIYFLWLVFSLIPMIQYELWLMTGLPLVIVTGFTLHSIADRWVGKRALFWSIQIGIYLSLLIGGQLIVMPLFYAS